MALDAYVSEAHARKDRKKLETVAEVVAGGNMPPKKNKEQPAKASVVASRSSR